jgi:iron complex outermembrane receptor protein
MDRNDRTRADAGGPARGRAAALGLLAATALGLVGGPAGAQEAPSAGVPAYDAAPTQGQRAAALRRIELALALPPARYAQLAPVQSGEPAEITLDTITVEGARDRGLPPPTGVVGQPPPAYAGGQVGSGTRVGLLGNQSVFDTPFNIVGVTEKLNRDQQSRSVADVVLNDPSVQAATPRGGPQDQFVIRGFRTFQQDILFDGIGGLVDVRRPAIENVERVEILKGPSALLNGVTVNGNIGGLINFIPKRATDEPITRYTIGYASRAEFGHYLDVGRRFGADNEWGVRYNGSYRNGPGAVDRSEIEWGFSSLGLDYRGERLRLSADLGYQQQDADPFISLRSALPGFRIPRPPNPRTNVDQPFTFSQTNHRFAASRAELDVTDWLTIYAAGGASRSEDLRYVGNTQIINARGDFRSTIFYEPQEVYSHGYDVGARASFDTGPIKHKVIVSASGVQRDGEFFSSIAVPSLVNNLYDPIVIPTPTNTGTFPRNGFPNNVTLNRGFAIADVISFFDERVIATVGVRHQEVGTKSFSVTPGPTFGSSTGRFKDSQVTPAVGLVVKPLERLSLYANYIEGLQAAPVAPTTAVNAGEIFPAFVAQQTEVGAKYDFGSVGVSVSAFDITRPFSFLDPTTRRFGVDGEQRNRGVELNAFGEPLPGLRLIGGVTLIEGRLERTAGGTLDGRTAPGVPQAQVSLYGEYDLPPAFMPGLTLTGRVLYSDSQFYDQANTQAIPDWTRVDLGLRYTTTGPTGKPLVLRASVENVFDNAYWQSAIDSLLSQGAPRTLLVSAQFDF